MAFAGGFLHIPRRVGGVTKLQEPLIFQAFVTICLSKMAEVELRGL
jgi:hypothetical protein